MDHVDSSFGPADVSFFTSVCTREMNFDAADDAKSVNCCLACFALLSLKPLVMRGILMLSSVLGFAIGGISQKVRPVVYGNNHTHKGVVFVGH